MAYRNTYQQMDRGLIEILGPHGICTFLYSFSNFFTRVHLSFIFHYVFFTFLGVLLLLLIFSNYITIILSFVDGTLLFLLFMYILLHFAYFQDKE
jgi:hypothetical protein